jgi:hypothetical protein
MKDKHFELTVDTLSLLVTYKKIKEDPAIPFGKANSLVQLKETNHFLSPRCSPNNSKIKEEEEGKEEGRVRVLLWKKMLDQSLDLRTAKTNAMNKLMITLSYFNLLSNCSTWWGGGGHCPPSNLSPPH